MRHPDRLLAAVRSRLGAPEDCGVDRVDRVVRDALRPGKLLRPDLVLRSAVAVPGVRRADARLEDRVVAGALATELLHVATLVHDDIIDASTVRRGRPSVVAELGAADAIVVGDLLLGRSAAAAAEAGVSAIWGRTLGRMAVGQLLEASLAARPSLAAHREYVLLKTAELFRASAEIGAVVVGAPRAIVEAHGRFGLHFGLAFQHVDDLLDVLGDPARMGKPAGLDAANGVPTAAALLLDAPSPEGLASQIAGELEEAAASLPPGRGSAELRAWAADALRRTLRTAGDGPRSALDRLTPVLDGLEHDIHPSRENQPCTAPSAR